jgi:hypothetical protein
MSVGRYLTIIFEGFVRSWWVLITGLASVLGWLALPDKDVTLGHTTSGVLLVLATVRLFLTVNVLFKAYGWFVGTSHQPRVLEFVPRPSSESTETPLCTFVIEERGWKLLPGHAFGLYRTVQSNEVCISVVRVDRGRHNDTAIQCIPVWISPVHLKQLTDDPTLARQLIVRREIPENRVAGLTQGLP